MRQFALLALLPSSLARAAAATAANATHASQPEGEWRWYTYPNNNAYAPTPGVENIGTSSAGVGSPEYCQSLCDADKHCNLVAYCAGPPCTTSLGYKAGECWLRRWVGERDYPDGLRYEPGFITYFRMWRRFDCKQFGEVCNPNAPHNDCCYKVFEDPICTNWGGDGPFKCWPGDRRRLKASAVLV